MHETITINSCKERIGVEKRPARIQQRLNKVYVLQLATIFVGFVIFGISENIKGPAIPRIQFDFMLSEAQVGTLLSLNSLGYLIACSFTAYLTRLWGIKRVTVMAFASMTIAGVFMFLAQQFGWFTASYFLMYIGNGMLEIALAILGARIFVRNTGMMMNIAHGFYGLSSIAAPLIATGLMKVTIYGYTLDWRGMYLVMLSLSIIPMILTLMGKFPEAEEETAERTPVSTLLRDPALWLTVLILTFGVVSELAVGGWLVNFLEKAYDWDTVSASGMLSMFFVCFTFARLFLGALTDRFGYTLSLIVFSLASGLCTFGALIFGESAAFLFALSGAGIAMIYPTVMALIAKRYPKESDTVITFTVTLMGVGSVIGNYLIGGVIEVTKHLYGSDTSLGLLRGLQAGYGVIGLCALLCTVSGIVLYSYLRKRKEIV